ncbi:MAG: malonyl-CoA synthase, partial [Pseudomonadota bacterium]
GVVAVLVAEPGAQLTEDDLKGAIAAKLASFKRPRRFFIVAELPRNTMGKVQKNILRDNFVDAFAPAESTP